MATIRKRGDSFQIRVSCGYDKSGNQVVRSMTWKPSGNMTEKQIQKELNRQAVMFEESCTNGYITATVKFQDFTERWFKECAEIKLKTQTIRSYHNCEKKVYKAIGHMRMDKITTYTIQRFITDLTNEKRYDSKGNELPSYAPKTIRNYVSFISSVFDYAVRMQVLYVNPCKNVVLPSKEVKEHQIYTVEEVRQMLELFKHESESNYKYTIFFTLAVFTGLRRGELLGLEWKDFDFDNSLMTVRRSSEWTKEKGIYTDTLKSKSSYRVLKLPDEIMTMLFQFREWQNDYKISLGDKWTEHDRLFTKWNGEPMGMRSPYNFLEKFCKRNGMRFVNIHSFRHFNASTMILSGVDVKTVQACLGHSSSVTTLDTYSHSFQESQARATDSVLNCILTEIKDKPK